MRRHLRIPRTAAGIITAALALSMLTACAPEPTVTPEPTPTPTQEPAPRVMEITIPILTVGGNVGSVRSEKIRITPTPGEALSVDLSEDEVGGFGESFQAAAWTSAVSATLLTGTSLEANYHFELRGLIDGPSAGGITTAAVLSLLLGDEFDPAVAMTGTISPTGTIGMVGGIPEKVSAVIDAGIYRKVLIPLGGRISPDTSGSLVDVVRLGSAGGVEVVEVGDITQAYQHLTGSPLPAPSSVAIPRLTEPGFTRMEAATERQLVSFTFAESFYHLLSEGVRSIADESYQSAIADAEEAERLLRQGLPGGAFIKAVQANLVMKAIVGAWSVIDDALREGVEVLNQRLSEASATERIFMEYLAKLDSYEVRTLPDAEALATSYGNSLDAYSLYLDAQTKVTGLLNSQFASFEEMLLAAVVPLLYLEFSIGQIEAAEAIFEMGKDIPGPPVAADADIRGIASFLRKAADANLEVFDSGLVARLADQAGVSARIARDRLGAVDLTIALAYSAKNVQWAVARYLGPENPNAAYAAMGYGWVNYARNATLMEKYSNNGVVDPQTMELTGVRSDIVLTHTLDFARGQLAESLEPLAAQGYSPMLIVGAFESAGLAREGGVDEKFQALETYTGSFAMARVLAYLGGFADVGYGTR